jgi:ATP-binding protein involved in chromosome partitioning
LLLSPHAIGNSLVKSFALFYIGANNPLIQDAIMTITSESVYKVIERALGKDAHHVSAITVKGGKVGFMITVPPAEKTYGLHLKAMCEEALHELPEVENVTIVVTAHESTPIPAKPEAGYNDPRARAQWNLTPIEGGSQVIAVASGKGGVGKSTTAVNLAHALTALGKKVGLLDADIYGPSIPHMLGLPHVQPEIVNNKMQPALAYGIEVMSMAFITGDEAAILRGPMISKSLQQMLRFTDWGSLDVLLVDMPPGTGDIHLSMAQQVPLSGAIIVTTPQPVAVMDATKCAKMFEKVNVRILGVIENMTGDIFGEGGGQTLAEDFNVPLLGTLPLNAAIREAVEQGMPPADKSYIEIAQKLV